MTKKIAVSSLSAALVLTFSMLLMSCSSDSGGADSPKAEVITAESAKVVVDEFCAGKSTGASMVPAVMATFGAIGDTAGKMCANPGKIETVSNDSGASVTFSSFCVVTEAGETSIDGSVSFTGNDTDKKLSFSNFSIKSPALDISMSGDISFIFSDAGLSMLASISGKDNISGESFAFADFDLSLAAGETPEGIQSGITLDDGTKLELSATADETLLSGANDEVIEINKATADITYFAPNDTQGQVVGKSKCM